jgi:branched-chain amino acid transport system ATP-binding protein
VTEAPVLEIRELSVAYGAVKALTAVDLDVGPGELVGLIGPNGAGKTTLIDAVTGFTSYQGTVRVAGKDLAGWAPHRRSRSGLTRTWQSADLFDDLTVRENVAVAAGRPKLGAVFKEAVTGRPVKREGVEQTLEIMRLQELADRPSDELTEGQRKLVGVARAFAPGPRVVCLDEPGAGLDRDESRELSARLRELTRGGVAMLLVDHDMDLIFGACDRVVVLDFGKVIARGTPAQVRENPAVVKAYLGGGPTLDVPGREPLSRATGGTRA